MEFVEVKDGYFLRLFKDQFVNAELAQFALDKKIKSAFFHGLGALKNSELGFYHLHKKEYQKELFTDESELLNLTGNISWLEDKPIIHSHVTLGDDKFRAFGGHLFEGQVAVTVEIYLKLFDVKVERRFVEDIGLNLLSFCPIK